MLLIGSVGPLGYLPASGTVTVALVGVPLFYVMSTWARPTYVFAVLVFSAASIWLHQIGDRILGEKDSRKLVWDELAGFMVAVAFLEFTWELAVVAFFLERLVDIVKIPPANWIEKRWPGGWGVVGDDLMAGLYTCVVLHLVVHFAPTLVGVSSV